MKDEGGRMKDEGGRMKDEGGRMKDEGGRMKDEGGRMTNENTDAEHSRAVSSFIPHPSSFDDASSFLPHPSSFGDASSFIPHPSSLQSFVTAGGRVLGVTATGNTLDEALETAYRAAELISWDGMQYRRDIGK